MAHFKAMLSLRTFGSLEDIDVILVLGSLLNDVVFVILGLLEGYAIFFVLGSLQFDMYLGFMARLCGLLYSWCLTRSRFTLFFVV